MYIVVDDECRVMTNICSDLKSSGADIAKFSGHDLTRWLDEPAADEIASVRGFVVSGVAVCDDDLRRIRMASWAPVLTVVVRKDLKQTLRWLSAGADDVLPLPTHGREIVARIDAVWRRSQGEEKGVRKGRLTVFADGSDPQIDGETFCLPRRERNILEYLVANAGRRMSKRQVFEALYGPLATGVDDYVIESHVSKLRRRLRQRLGHDVIDCRRRLGYCFVG
ncbi:DNA-binding response regulator, OmpR family, contains REC and winged-helix (wHTH) domain [Pseudoxanthobacter soli DSM 19599]|uniref:DNA-binding response regulator, OmpR family, contains REC and winged-helix (WHTH) domain n=2 Tax=Pseudoxanthobacter TaxID=433838 RepID=A0A1M7Z9I2_9HYPH|nr:DNA-binding response regulator, OmpR family, contains REC and winged-helix (wHTH) domain [Pseudoxanthobacter soli DSM 19599]